MKTRKNPGPSRKASRPTKKLPRETRAERVIAGRPPNTTPAYAAQSAKTPLAPFNIQRREVGRHDIQIEILYCGVCHSDLHMARNEWGATIYPVVPGHEIVGRVTAVGKQVSKFRPGDLAGVGVMVDSCRECANCRRGLQQYCTVGTVLTYSSRDKRTGEITQGGYSKSIVTTEGFVFSVSDKLPLASVAPLLCAGITTYSPLRHWKVGKGTKLGVVGLGGLGHMALKFASSFGAEVTMLSTSPEKEKDARRLGAQKFALTTDASQMERLANYFDVILDTVSAKHDYNKYLNLISLDGSMVLVGIPPVPGEFQVFTLMGQRRRLASSGIGGVPETQEMLDYCAEHDISSDIELIDIDSVNEAYTRMLKGDVRYRFVIDMKSLG
jgi:uncharacterized zinc-type alcohol dehydrogenase-like protein